MVYKAMEISWVYIFMAQLPTLITLSYSQNSVFFVDKKTHENLIPTKITNHTLTSLQYGNTKVAQDKIQETTIQVATYVGLYLLSYSYDYYLATQLARQLQLSS